MGYRISRSRFRDFVAQNQELIVQLVVISVIISVIALGCRGTYNNNNRLMHQWWTSVPQHNCGYTTCVKCGSSGVTRIIAPKTYMVEELGEAMGFSEKIVPYLFLVQCEACKRVIGYERTNDAPDDIVQHVRKRQ